MKTKKRIFNSRGIAVIFAFLTAFSFNNSVLADEKLKSVIAGEHRSDKNKARDQYRHPYETLTFFGIKPNMTVVELSPGGGWYAEIIAPYLKDSGQYIGAGFDPNSDIEFFSKNAKRFAKKLKDNAKLYGNAQVSVLQPPSLLNFADADSADMVVSFRNAHHWHRKGDAANIYQSIFKSLKPGGVFGIVQHRAGKEFPTDKKGNKGYLPQNDVIKMVEAAGFKLVKSAPINANPKDLKNYEKGVWALAPSFRGGKTDEIAAIGESDRMTLKFIKPASK